MTATEFKNIWMSKKLDSWTEFPIDQVERSNLSEETKAFLKVGFPEDAAPYLDFGVNSYDGNFNTVQGYYGYDELDKITQNCWILGSDNNGNPICIDASNNDKIIILDHEQGFQFLESMNNNIYELASSLLIYRNFIRRVNDELGPDGFFESKFNETHITELENEFKALNSEYYIESSFWDTEIENLRYEIE